MKKNYICKYDDCNIRSSYGFSIKTHCSKHKLPGMKYVYGSCELCAKIASFGLCNDKKPKRCKDHKEKEMIDIRTPRCELCDTIPSYAYPNKKIAKRCFKHIENDMHNVRSARCTYENCNKHAYYGYDNPIYCPEHKKPDMKNFSNRHCDICGKIAIFGYVNQQQSRCRIHKAEDMIDVKNKRCKYQSCSNLAHYGHTSIEFCKLHAANNMIPIGQTLCEINNCNTIAAYGLNNKRMRCCIHKTDKMIDVISRRCSSCNIFITKAQQPLCSYCNPNSRIKTREKTVVDFLNSQNLQFSHNKSIGQVCGAYKPDILIDCNTHFIDLEIDEDQHKKSSYDHSCELARMNNIYIANGLPTIFLRYNPDSFKCNNKLKRIGKDKRLQHLLERVTHHQNNIPTKPITVEYIYYDCDCDKCDFIHDNTDKILEEIKELF